MICKSKCNSSDIDIFDIEWRMFSQSDIFYIFWYISSANMSREGYKMGFIFCPWERNKFLTDKSLPSIRSTFIFNKIFVNNTGWSPMCGSHRFNLQRSWKLRISCTNYMILIGFFFILISIGSSVVLGAQVHIFIQYSVWGWKNEKNIVLSICFGKEWRSLDSNCSWQLYICGLYMYMPWLIIIKNDTYIFSLIF